MIDAMMAVALALQPTEAQCNVPRVTLPRGCTVWSPLSQSGGAEVLADLGSVRRREGGFDLTVRMVFAEEQYGGVRSGVITYRFDCARETGTMQRSRYFDANGRYLAGGETRNAPVNPSPPGSPNRAALDRFCAGDAN